MRDKAIIIKSEKSYIKVNINEILFCKASGAYTEIFREGQPFITTPKLLKEFEIKLVDFNFFRISRSIFVNLDHCIKINNNGTITIELSNGELLDVAASRRKRLKEQFCKTGV